MAFSKQEIIHLYRKRARRYDLTANLYYLIGIRETAYRKKAIAALGLRKGDTVLEIGCGTGLNFPYLQKAVGPEGKIIGLDLTDRMLDQARARVEEKGWSNVELIQADAAAHDFPTGLQGIISTFALTLTPDYDCIIQKSADALASGGRFVLLDMKKPDNLPTWLVNLMVFITKPFGVTLDLSDRHLWESIATYFAHTSFEELFFGFLYVAVGQQAEDRSST